MTENFNKPYRRFAEAALRSGVPKGDRKLARENPDFLRYGRTQELQERVPPGALKLLFEFLSGNHNIDSRLILNIGNFLYEHRTDRQNGDKKYYEALSPDDRPLVNLASALIEDAFYRGDFLDLSEELGASLNFTVNMLAQIFGAGRSREGLKGFNREKLERFLNEVEAFEERTYRADRQDKKYEDRLHTYFLAADRRAREAMNEKHALMYLIKYVLIVDNYLLSLPLQARAGAEEEICVQRGPLGNQLDYGHVAGMYNMLSHQRDSVPQKGEHHAAPHFFPEYMPFALWALRYLRFKKSLERVKRVR